MLRRRAARFPLIRWELNVQGGFGNCCDLLWRIKIGRHAASALNRVRSAR